MILKPFDFNHSVINSKQLLLIINNNKINKYIYNVINNSLRY